MAADGIAAALRALVAPGQVFEIRALKCSTPSFRREHTRGGYFDSYHIDSAANAANILTNSCNAKGVYFTLNPLRGELLSRRANRVDVIGKDDHLTTAADVVRRSHLLIDCDPVRPSGISSNREERQAALKTAQAIQSHLSSLGWPAPALGDSGNGWHLLYRIDLPADDQGVVQRCLHALDGKFSSPVVGVDRVVFDANRICKLYGTISRKGDSTPDRPHRQSRLCYVPPDFRVVPNELLNSLAQLAPEPKPQQRGKSQHRASPTVADRVEAYIAKCRPSVSGEHGHDNAYRVACTLIRGFNLSPEAAMPYFERWNQTCQPPWSGQELKRKLEEAERSADDEPGFMFSPDHGNNGHNHERLNVDSFTLDGFDVASQLHSTTRRQTSSDSEFSSLIPNSMYPSWKIVRIKANGE